MTKTLMILGATGQVGQQLLQQALAHREVSHIIAPTRRALTPHAKLFNPLVDFHLLPLADWWRADACVCALGTTLKLAGSKQAFREVDHDYVLHAARQSRQAGTPTYVYNSSVGASVRAGSFYLRVKGEVEDDLSALGFPSLTLVRPSVLDTQGRPDSRPGEAVSLRLMKLAGAWVPARYRPVTPAAVARSMLGSAIRAAPGRHVTTNEKLLG